MITRVRFQNFKALRDVQIDFTAPLTVFVGPNACGKTSVLQAVSLASEFFERAKNDRLSLTSSLVNRQASGPIFIDISLRSRSGRPADLSLQTELQVLPLPEQINLRQVAAPKNAHDTLAQEARKIVDQAVLRVANFAPTGLLRLDPVVLAKPSYTGDKAPKLGDDGAGLASVLAETATADPARFAQIQDALRAVIPAVKQVRLLRTSVEYSVQTHDPAGDPTIERRKGQGHKIHFDFQGADKVPADQASEGTLLVLGWLTALLGEGGRSLLLIDDLDRGLHPKAQAELIAILRRLLAQNPDLQIVATSHSPYLLDKLKPDEIRLMTLDDEGAALCGALSEHPDYPRWKDLMLPGEAWSTLGEGWLKGRAPKTDA